MILDDIVAYKKRKLEQEKNQTSLNKIIAKIKSTSIERVFKEALMRADELSIIAEIKKASPSKGIIREDFNVLIIAEIYDRNNVNAISVLTEDKFFKGRDEYLSMVKEHTKVPILRKDFIIDPYQIYQSKLLGADAILLIASILSEKELNNFQCIAQEIGLQCLVEIHNKDELAVVLSTQADIIGINNRNLQTFETKLENTEKLIEMIPTDKTVISESGINTRADMEYIRHLGVNGVLIGESLMRCDSITDKLKELRGG